MFADRHDGKAAGGDGKPLALHADLRRGGADLDRWSAKRDLGQQAGFIDRKKRY